MDVGVCESAQGIVRRVFGWQVTCTWFGECSLEIGAHARGTEAITDAAADLDEPGATACGRLEDRARSLAYIATRPRTPANTARLNAPREIAALPGARQWQL
jgi:hypothetical protein